MKYSPRSSGSDAEGVRDDGRQPLGDPGWRDRLSVIARRGWLRATWRRQSRRHAKALRLLDRTLRDAPVTVVSGAPAIDQIARELRRLDRQRRSVANAQSERWRAAVERAYDAWLALACRALDLPEHLAVLDGLDRDLERLRIEEELQRSGLRLAGEG